jgi:hypothetical protein
MELNNFKFPAWIDEFPEEERQRERSRFILRLVALHASREGTLGGLTPFIGLSKYSIYSMLSVGSFDKGLPVNVVKGVEALIGFGAIPREILNPEIYGEPSETL